MKYLALDESNKIIAEFNDFEDAKEFFKDNQKVKKIIVRVGNRNLVSKLLETIWPTQL